MFHNQLIHETVDISGILLAGKTTKFDKKQKNNLIKYLTNSLTYLIYFYIISMLMNFLNNRRDNFEQNNSSS